MSQKLDKVLLAIQKILFLVFIVIWWNVVATHDLGHFYSIMLIALPFTVFFLGDWINSRLTDLVIGVLEGFINTLEQAGKKE